MKLIFRNIVIVWLSTVIINALAQNTPGNYYVPIKTFNLSTLWRDNTIQSDGGDRLAFPEPLGIIGNDYQRFYIHYTSVVKDAVNPCLYIVKGKTRVKNNICSFKGTIAVLSAKRFNESYIGYKQGKVVCDVHLYEDSSSRGSGYIKGKLTTQFCINKKGQMLYDALDSNADGYFNNQFDGTWTSYKTGVSKMCNWGDYRIPDSKGLDGGAGEFIVNEKYKNNGWQNYVNMNSQDKAVAKKAVDEENRKWWE